MSASMNRVDMASVIREQRAYFRRGLTRPLGYRIEALRKLKEAVLAHEESIYKALEDDLGKSRFEAFSGEIGLVLSEIEYALKNLKKWSRAVKVRTPWLHFPGKSYVCPEPYGTALIISPWNFPFQLTLLPLIGSMAGGNTAVIKPSSSAPHASGVIHKIIRETFDPAYVQVLEIGREEADFLLEQKFDLIFYTGSSAVGKTIMEKASKNLTPVVLELSGKNPCLVDWTADLRTSARRIVWGKFFNAGQSCVAPDYILADQRIKSSLVLEMQSAVEAFYGENPELSGDFCRIINRKRMAELKGHLQEGTIVTGGDFDDEARYLAPTLIDGVQFNSGIMRQEIFGPILPVLEYAELDQAIRYLTDQPKPLSIYVFTGDEKIFQKIQDQTTSGSLVLNDTVTQHTSKYLPFGGVGESGIGSYHGKSSFDAFTHQKSVMKNSFLLDFKFRYPPYTKLTPFLKRFIRWVS